MPIFFTKAPTTVNGPYDRIPWDRAATAEVDYEVELGVILGANARNLTREFHCQGEPDITQSDHRDRRVTPGKSFFDCHRVSEAVGKGTLVGKNWGKVSRITQDEVIISEEYRDFEGKLIVHEIPLKMPKGPEDEEIE